MRGRYEHSATRYVQTSALRFDASHTAGRTTNMGRRIVSSIAQGCPTSTRIGIVRDVGRFYTHFLHRLKNYIGLRTLAIPAANDEDTAVNAFIWS